MLRKCFHSYQDMAMILSHGFQVAVELIITGWLLIKIVLMIRKHNTCHYSGTNENEVGVCLWFVRLYVCVYVLVGVCICLRILCVCRRLLVFVSLCVYVHVGRGGGGGGGGGGAGAGRRGGHDKLW